MIDFEKLIKETPRNKSFEDVEELITKVESTLASEIKKDTDRNTWTYRYTNNSKSTSAMKELYDYIMENYVATNKTQMKICWCDEYNGYNYQPAAISFSVSRKK